MLKADAKRFDDLAATDEAVRVAAANALGKLKKDHFYSHPVGKDRLSPGKEAALVSAWRETQSDVVRAWIAQVLVLTHCDSIDARSLVDASLHLDMQYPVDIFNYVSDHAYHLGKREAVEVVKAFHQHPDPEVRWRCAYSLEYKELDYQADSAVIRKLMRDTDPTTREKAFKTATRLNGLGPADFEVFLDLHNMSHGYLRKEVKALMDNMSATVPGCTPSAFAPRVPALRADGLYWVNKHELSAAGTWVSARCLRFFPDGEVHCFGTNVVPVEFGQTLPHQDLKAARGTVAKQDAQVSFSVESADGTFDFSGEIEGDQIHLTCVDRRSGKKVVDTYNFMYMDWKPGQPTQVGKPAKKAAKKGAPSAPLPFEPLKPKSMFLSDANKWYVQMVARMPAMLDGAQTDAEKLAMAWRLRNEMRESAAKSLIDQTFKAEFYARLPLPGIEELLRQSAAKADPVAAAFKAVLAVTEAERRKFPGTIGEHIGLECQYGEENYVMTETGWALKPSP